MGFFFEEIFHFAKTTEFSLSVAWRTGIVQIHVIFSTIKTYEEKRREEKVTKAELCMMRAT
jgi:hypothetical protein